MRAIDLYPLKLQPALHVKVWGGMRLHEELDKPPPDDQPYGESWELHDSVVVNNGPLAGQTLREIMNENASQLLGRCYNATEGFPLLAKFIDAEQWLSIQVHPDDAQARDLEGEPRGKTEAWIVIFAEEGAQLITGFSPGTSRETVAEALDRNQLEEHLTYEPVASGDVLYIPANTVHALGPGLLIYEIQQSSDTTYRLYDWGRLGLDGQPRQLHIEKGLQVARLDHLPTVTRPKGELLVESPYFVTWRHQLTGQTLSIATGEIFHCLTCIEGRLQLYATGHESVALGKGETGLIPACIDKFSIEGTGTVLRSCQKTPQSLMG